MREKVWWKLSEWKLLGMLGSYNVTNFDKSHQ